MNKPNILIFMTDQQRGDSIKNEDYIMPNLNKFADNGINFTEVYCTAPHCCPSRASFFSGEFPTKHGVWNNVLTSITHSEGLKKDVDLWSEHLAKNDYNLFYSGKWHVDSNKDPKDFGWKELMVTASASDPEFDEAKENWKMYQNDHMVKEGDTRQAGEITRPGYPTYIHYGTNENPFNDETVVSTALTQLQELNDSNDDKPWCMYVGTLGPHDAYTPPQRFLDMYKDIDITLPTTSDDKMFDKPTFYRMERDLFDVLSDEEKIEAIRHYRAFCTYEDDLFGRVLEELEKNNQRENTLIIFLSDHGDYNGEHGLWAKGLPPFKGAYHIPLVMQWDKYSDQKGITVDNFVSISDLFNTILDASINKTIDSKESISLLPYLKGQKPLKIRDAIFTQTNGNEVYGIQRSVMTKDYKFVFNTFDEDELYDLNMDKNEAKNVARDQKYDKALYDMYMKMWDFAYKNDDNIINPYIMVTMAKYGPGELFNKDKKK